MRKLLFYLFIAVTSCALGVSVQKTLWKTLFESVPVVQINEETSVDKCRYANTEAVNSQNESEDFYSAWYSAEDFEGMKEVWTIYVTKEVNNDNSGKAVWSAIIMTNDENRDFSSVRINVDDRALSFKSKRAKGVEYKFSGEFFKGRKTGAESEKLLRGSLQKFVRGKLAATIKTDFQYNEPKCWH